MLVKAEIGDAGIHFKNNPVIYKPFLQGAHHGVVLIINGAQYAFEAIKARNHMGKAYEITFELNGAMPRLEGESCAPHKPEIRLKKSIVELIAD